MSGKCIALDCQEDTVKTAVCAIGSKLLLARRFSKICSKFFVIEDFEARAWIDRFWGVQRSIFCLDVACSAILRDAFPRLARRPSSL